MFQWLIKTFNWFFNNIMKKNTKIVFLGLDNAGKTTLLHDLNGYIFNPMPTMHPSSNEVLLGSLRCNTFDLGGHQQGKHFFKSVFYWHILVHLVCVLLVHQSQFSGNFLKSI